MQDYLKVDHRDIAKMLASALPVEGEEFGLIVETYLQSIRALPRKVKLALKCAYVFSRKVPREEREDMFQDIALAVFKAKATEERLAYAIARCDWLNWWRKYKIRQHTSLDSIVEDTEGNQVTLGEMLVGECEFENKVNGKLDAERIFSKLPERIKPIIIDRLLGRALNSSNRNILNRWVKSEGYKLLIN